MYEYIPDAAVQPPLKYLVMVCVLDLRLPKQENFHLLCVFRQYSDLGSAMSVLFRDRFVAQRL